MKMNTNGHKPIKKVSIIACKATVDMFHLTKKDFCPQVDDIISVGQFYEKSAGAQIVFT